MCQLLPAENYNFSYKRLYLRILLQTPDSAERKSRIVQNRSNKLKGCFFYMRFLENVISSIYILASIYLLYTNFVLYTLIVDTQHFPIFRGEKLNSFFPNFHLNREGTNMIKLSSHALKTSLQRICYWLWRSFGTNLTEEEGEGSLSL